MSTNFGAVSATSRRTFLSAWAFRCRPQRALSRSHSSWMAAPSSWPRHIFRNITLVCVHIDGNLVVISTHCPANSDRTSPIATTFGPIVTNVGNTWPRPAVFGADFAPKYYHILASLANIGKVFIKDRLILPNVGRARANIGPTRAHVSRSFPNLVSSTVSHIPPKSAPDSGELFAFPARCRSPKPWADPQCRLATSIIRRFFHRAVGLGPRVPASPRNQSPDEIQATRPPPRWV